MTLVTMDPRNLTKENVKSIHFSLGILEMFLATREIPMNPKAEGVAECQELQALIEQLIKTMSV